MHSKYVSSQVSSKADCVQVTLGTTANAMTLGIPHLELPKADATLSCFSPQKRLPFILLGDIIVAVVQTQVVLSKVRNKRCSTRQVNHQSLYYSKLAPSLLIIIQYSTFLLSLLCQTKQQMLVSCVPSWIYLLSLLHIPVPSYVHWQLSPFCRHLEGTSNASTLETVLCSLPLDCPLLEYLRQVT